MRCNLIVYFQSAVLEWSTYIHNKRRRKGSCSKTGNYISPRRRRKAISSILLQKKNPASTTHDLGLDPQKDLHAIYTWKGQWVGCQSIGKARHLCSRFMNLHKDLLQFVRKANPFGVTRLNPCLAERIRCFLSSTFEWCLWTSFPDGEDHLPPSQG